MKLSSRSSKAYTKLLVFSVVLLVAEITTRLESCSDERRSGNRYMILLLRVCQIICTNLAGRADVHSKLRVMDDGEGGRWTHRLLFIPEH